MKLTVLEALGHHLTDLRYRHAHGGLDFVNHGSCGTPAFNEDKEFMDYTRELMSLSNKEN
jgi:hypothetical protein